MEWASLWRKKENLGVKIGESEVKEHNESWLPRHYEWSHKIYWLAYWTA